MRALERDIDWPAVEDRLYVKKCGSGCYKVCCCFKTPCKLVRYKLRKTRLEGMATKPKKGIVDYLIYSLV